MFADKIRAILEDYRIGVRSQSLYCKEQMEDAILEDPEYVDLQEIIDELEALCANVRETIESLEDIRDENE